MVVFVGIVMLWSHGWPPSTWIRPDFTYAGCHLFFVGVRLTHFVAAIPKVWHGTSFHFRHEANTPAKAFFPDGDFISSVTSLQEFVRTFFLVTEERKSNCCKDFWFVFDCVVNIYMIGETSLGWWNSTDVFLGGEWYGMTLNDAWVPWVFLFCRENIELETKRFSKPQASCWHSEIQWFPKEVLERNIPSSTKKCRDFFIWTTCKNP